MSEFNPDQPQDAGQAEASAAARSRKRMLQALGLKALNPLHAIVRNLRMYDVENRIFEQSLGALGNAISETVAYDQLFDLQLSGTVASLNNQMLRLEFSLLSHLRQLTSTLKERNIGGITTDRALSADDLKRFFRALWSPTSEGMGVTEAFSLSEARADQYIKTSTVNDATNRLQKHVTEAILMQRRMDRQTYSVVLYTRALQFMRRVVSCIQRGVPVENAGAASRIVRDLVDLAREHRKHFLGLAGIIDAGDYIPYHSVNTTLLCIAMGNTLRLSREQMLELGKAALFHDIGAASIDPSIAYKRGGLTEEERVTLSRNPLQGAKTLLKTRPLDLGTLKSMLSAVEAKHHFYAPVVDANGASVYVPRNELGIFGRIIRIASVFDALVSPRPFRPPYPPSQALQLMNSQMRHEYDPRLLDVFNHIIRSQVMESAQTQAPSPIGF